MDKIMSVSSATPARATHDGPTRVAKIVGADVELGNFVEGVETIHGTAAAAARLLLREIDGVPAGYEYGSGQSTVPGTGLTLYGSGASIRSHDDEEARSSSDPQEWGRRFLPTNSGSIYVDLDHLELAQPETSNAFDFVASARAMLTIAQTALRRANDRMPAGRRIVALANCSDGLGHSYGAHVNVLVTRSAWDHICVRKPHYLACLAAFQASSIIYTGAGKVGSENGRQPVAYQLSQRADFVEALVGPQTTYERPLVNARLEPLCGRRSWQRNDDDGDLSRLHVIFYDHTLAQVATLLKVGTLQIMAAILEAGAVNAELALDDPLEALLAWSNDPTLTGRARTLGGGASTALDLQFQFLGEAKSFADTGGLDAIVPRAAEILTLWEDTLVKLRGRDFPALARRLDWVLKLGLLRRAMERRPALDWTSPEVKHLDQIYASLDDSEGLFLTYEREGLVDRVVSDEAVAYACTEPPPDTRAWTRAHLLRLAGEARIDQVDWDAVRVKLTGRFGSGVWPTFRTVDLPHPAKATRAEHGALFDHEPDLEQVVARLGAEDEPADRAHGPTYLRYPIS
jgi:proteasome accessory factor A